MHNLPTHDVDRRVKVLAIFDPYDLDEPLKVDPHRFVLTVIDLEELHDPAVTTTDDVWEAWRMVNSHVGTPWTDDLIGRIERELCARGEEFPWASPSPNS